MSTQKLPDPVIISSKGGLTSTSGQITFGSTTYTFPPDGPSGYVLTTNGSATLSWQPPTPGTVTPPTDVYANYTMLATDSFIRYRGTADATVTLLQSSAVSGKQLLIENQSSFILTVQAHSGDTIDGDTLSITLDARYASASLASDGLGNWLLI